jgi:hypothetical protein
VVPRSGIFRGKWRSSFAGSSDGKMNVQSACTLNTRYLANTEQTQIVLSIFRIKRNTKFSQNSWSTIGDKALNTTPEFCVDFMHLFHRTYAGKS